MMADFFNFAVITIFAREFLEGSIIIGEYRTFIIRGGDALAPGLTRKRALSEVTLAAIAASALALFILACIAIPLAILSSTFHPRTAHIVEGVSKIVAAASLLQLSLKLPKILGIYKSCKTKKGIASDRDASVGLTLRSIRFNVAWNIWREVAECGVFLLPVFLSGSGLQDVPLSCVVGSVLGLALGVGIYYANQKLENRNHLCVFAVLLLVSLSAGLFTGGCHLLEKEIRLTKQVWRLTDKVWQADRLPMTIIKPFGYDDSKTILQIASYWLWLLFSLLLHLRKYLISPRVSSSLEPDPDVEGSTDHVPGSPFWDETVPSNGDTFSADISRGDRR
jgi:high-affinity iron transporter